jgi:hypothetical protein
LNFFEKVARRNQWAARNSNRRQNFQNNNNKKKRNIQRRRNQLTRNFGAPWVCIVRTRPNGRKDFDFFNI